MTAVFRVVQMILRYYILLLDLMFELTPSPLSFLNLLVKLVKVPMSSSL
jgi:hypothetical protein